MVIISPRDSHKVSSVIVPCHGRRFKLFNQNPDDVDEDDYVDLEEKHAQWPKWQNQIHTS